MSGTHVPSGSSFGHRIAQLDEGAARMIKFHSGTRPDAPTALLEALEGHYRRFPKVPVIRIHRKPSSKGRRGGVDNVACGFCPQSGKFQKIADHIVNEHFKLTLWYCGLNSCTAAVSRKSDLVRHQLVVHKVARPRKAKAERRSQVSSPADIPSSSPTPSVSPGPGPMRNGGSRSRSRDPSYSPSYSVHSTLVESAHSSGDTISWPDGYMDIQQHSGPGHRQARGRGDTSYPLAHDRGGHPILVLPETTPPTNRISSLPDDRPRFPSLPYSGRSSSGLGIGALNTISPSGQAPVRTSQPSATIRQVEPCLVFEGYNRSEFLSPPSRAPVASSSGIGLSPLPAPVYRVTTPIQSKSVHLGMYHATDLTEGMQLPLPPNPQRASIHESSPCPVVSYPMATSPQYYPPRAQIDMPNAVPVSSFPTGHWVPTLSGPPSRSYTPYPVDEEFSFNLAPPEVLFSPLATHPR